MGDVCLLGLFLFVLHHGICTRCIQTQQGLGIGYQLVDLKTADGSVGVLSRDYLSSTSHQETVTTLTNHFNLLSESSIRTEDDNPLPQGHMSMSGSLQRT